jgi:hypothetical protein
MSELRTSFDGRALNLWIGKDLKTREGRRELIDMLLRVYGELRTFELTNLLEQATVHKRTRTTLSGDLKWLISQDKAEKVHKGLYRSKHPPLFPQNIHERDELCKFAESCNYCVRQEMPRHPIGTTYILSKELRPKGWQHRFSDIGERVLARCVQNVLFSSYLRTAGQKHLPIAPCQLDGRAEIPDDWLERIWREKAFTGKILVAFAIDFQELHKWLKTTEGKNWLGTALKETPKEFRHISEGIVKALEFIDKNSPVDANKVIHELENLGLSDVWILPYIESEEVEGRMQYRINAEGHNIMRGLTRIESGGDPAKTYRLMQD